MNNWREQIQKEIDQNNANREASVRRTGDDKTEYKACVDWAGKAREIKR